MTRVLWTISDVLRWAGPWLDSQGVDSGRLTAEVLLSHALGTSRIGLYTDLERPLAQDELSRYRALILRRARGEPVQYLTGFREFYGRRFACDKRALIPRPETELLVEYILEHVGADLPVRVVDVGCGTGVIGVTLAAERPGWSVVLTDVSPEALDLARANASALGVSDRVEFRTGDLCAPLGDDTWDVVAANLPYIPEVDRPTLAVHVRDHEPALALFSGPDGLDLYRRFVPEVTPRVRSGGLFICEHAEQQGAPLRSLLEAQGWIDIETRVDLAGLDRLTCARRPGGGPLPSPHPHT